MKIAKEHLKQIIKEELDKVQKQGPRYQKPALGKKDVLSKILSVFDGPSGDTDIDRHPKLTAILQAVTNAFGDVPLNELIEFLRDLHREMAVNKKVLREDNEIN
tara:strand:- start:1865 stop:2176 length:312 start_codon:yes stop_codon:yes gene_type:complete